MPERTPIDPTLRVFLDELAVSTPKLPPGISDTDRAALARTTMLRALESRRWISGLPNGAGSRDVLMDDGLRGRLYTPPEAGGGRSLRPVLVYLHGGGWVVGSVVTHDPFCLLLSELAGVIILSVEYRLAPEHRYPAALEDAIAAYRWAAAHAVEFGGDARRLALGGDSAGGNLAAAAANQLCAAGEGESLRAQMLLYPVTDSAAAQYPSRQENATGYGLELPVMEWFWQQYAGAAEPADPGAYPMHQQPLPKLPPTLVTTAEYDLLRDEGIAYAEKLKAAGVAVTHRHAADMHHNFPISPGTVQRFPQSVATLREIAVWLSETLSSR